MSIQPAQPVPPEVDVTPSVVTDAPTFEESARQPAEVDRPGPSLGRFLHVLVAPSINNGSDVAPAVVTRIYPRTPGQPPLVNLRVFLDADSAQGAEWATSRYVHQSEVAARAAADGESWVGISSHAFWPMLR